MVKPLSCRVGDVVCLHWLDSSREEGWTRQVPETADALRCQSVGRVFALDDSVITVAGHWTDEENPQRCGGLTIPAAAITSVRVLE